MVVQVLNAQQAADYLAANADISACMYYSAPVNKGTTGEPCQINVVAR